MRARPPWPAGSTRPTRRRSPHRWTRLLATSARPTPAARPVALIAPHAGYRYSGPVAATAYAQLAAWRDEVIAGRPARTGALRAAEAGWRYRAWTRSPRRSGPVAVDLEARRGRRDCRASWSTTRRTPRARLETQLPFLLRALGPGVRVLPVLVGADRSGRGRRAAVALLRPDVRGRRLHRPQPLPGPGAGAGSGTPAPPPAILARDPRRHPGRRTPAATGRCAGCCSHAADRDSTSSCLQLATSADAGADPGRVVGYGAFLLHVAEIIATSRSLGAAAVGDAPRRE